MENQRFDYNKMYTAVELADMFELPLFVRKENFFGNYVFKITSVSERVYGEYWDNGRPVRRHSYSLDTRFYVCFNPKPVFRNKKRRMSLFPVVVMATMSSGKSTLINALLNKNLLPSSNFACTAKSYRIYDNDNDDVTEIDLVYLSGEKETISCADWTSVLHDANNNPDIVKIDIRMQIQGVFNSRNKLVLVDTPGTNNSQDETHGKITYDILSKIKEGLIVYIINATQFGIHDDSVLLSKVSETIRKNKNLGIVFVVNKCDKVDTEKESFEKLIQDVQDYLTREGFVNPDIIPTSALYANLLRKQLRGELLTSKESRMLKCYVEQFNSIEDALEDTGIPQLERYLQEAKNTFTT